MLIKDQRGVTMVEVLLVIVILTILAAMSFSSYRTWQKQILLINTRDEIKSALARAQQLATAASGNAAWGLHLATSTYTVFPGSFYNETDPDNKTWVLNGVEIVDSYITFSDGAGGYTSDVVFSKFDGETYNTGTVEIIIASQPSFSKTVTVQSPGQID
jgi:prepilin-type N-terminal cleavage/methylation domain-containing protein